MDEQETQFHAALLIVGKPPGRLRDCLMFHERKTINSYDYTAFKLHKSKLIEHLESADYFDVYYEQSRLNGKKIIWPDKMLTEKAALWVGKFYQWVLATQEKLHSV